MPECALSDEQIATLSRGLARLADVIIAYYKEPEHEAAFQAWHLEKYGHPAPEGV